MALANVNAPRGFQLLRWGGKRFPKTVQRHCAAARSKDIMIGDAVVTAAGVTVRATAATDNITGIVVGIALNPIAASPAGPVSQDYIPAADAGDVIVCEDPDAEYAVQIATLASTDPPTTAAVVDADGSQLLRQSRQSVILDATPGQLQFEVIELLNQPESNSYGAFAQVVVRLLETP